jgi:hypothetical protein
LTFFITNEKQKARHVAEGHVCMPLFYAMRKQLIDSVMKVTILALPFAVSLNGIPLSKTNISLAEVEINSFCLKNVWGGISYSSETCPHVLQKSPNCGFDVTFKTMEIIITAKKYHFISMLQQYFVPVLLQPMKASFNLKR